MKTGLPVLLTILVALNSALFFESSGQSPVVPVPLVSGPVTGPGTIFSASLANLSASGYIEEEFFLEGKARRYSFKPAPGSTELIDTQFPGSFLFNLDGIPGFAIPDDTLYPYKTRIIVRRPADKHKFNGMVIVEWLNVASMYDIDPNWFHLHPYLMRSGTAWVGVSAEKAGIHSLAGLRKWNPGRYGNLDVTADSTLLQDQLRFDIYSQAAMALMGEQNVRPLGNLKPEVIIASGHSRSAFMLTGYYNFIQPLAGIFDGFIILGAGGKLRTDLPAKVFKINSETDLVELGQVAARQPDSDRLVTWEFAGTSHADQTFLDFHSAICKRDFGNYKGTECDKPRCSLVPFYYGFAAAVTHLDRWIRQNIQPPAGIPVTIKETNPVVILARDSLGNTLGGIRLPQFDVPVAMNSGLNAGPGSCRFYGTHKAFDQQTLKSLYPTHRIYMKKCRASVKENLKAGYILREDTDKMLNEAGNLYVLWK